MIQFLLIQMKNKSTHQPQQYQPYIHFSLRNAAGGSRLLREGSGGVGRWGVAAGGWGCRTVA